MNQLRWMQIEHSHLHKAKAKMQIEHSHLHKAKAKMQIEHSHLHKEAELDV